MLALTDDDFGLPDAAAEGGADVDLGGRSLLLVAEEVRVGGLLTVDAMAIIVEGLRRLRVEILAGSGPFPYIDPLKQYLLQPAFSQEPESNYLL